MALLVYYTGTLDFRLRDIGVTDNSTRAHYCHMYTLICSSCAVLIPVVGYTIDQLGFTFTWLVAVTLAVLWSCFLLLESIPLLPLAFVFAALFRTFLYTFVYAYLADTLGFQYFGLLSGILFTICGFVGLTQYQLGQWARDTCVEDESNPNCHANRWTVVNIVVLLGFLATYVFCALDYTDRYGDLVYTVVRSDEENYCTRSIQAEMIPSTSLLENKTSAVGPPSSTANYSSISGKESAGGNCQVGLDLSVS